MATTTEDERKPEFEITTNWTPEVIMGGLIVVFVLGAVLASVLGKEEPSPIGDPGVRAVVVPTADRPRTVVVPPCGTGVRITPRNAAGQIGAPGATVVQLPVNAQPRVVLVPRCSASVAQAGATDIAAVPSSAFVLAAGAKTAVGTTGTEVESKKKDKVTGKKDKGTLEPRSQVIVPTASEADVVVVPPCTGTGTADRADVLEPPPESPTTLVAPHC